MLSRNDDKFLRNSQNISINLVTIRLQLKAVAYFSAWVCWPPLLAGSAGPGPWHSGSDSPTSNVEPGVLPSKMRPCSPKL